MPRPTVGPADVHAIDGSREPVLDGIRGLAVLLVLFHHLVYSSGIDRKFALDWGVFRLAYSSWLGVDLFFVLSGFLITGILYEAKGSVHYFRNFYGRRALRIFPLYYGFLIVSLLLFPHWLPPESGENLIHAQGWYWSYLSNVYVAMDGWQEPSHLGHFWSLALEEQFYLLWPMAVWALSRSQLVRLAVACFLGALAIRIILPFDMSPLAAYVLLPTRMDSLAAGAFLALLIRGERGTAILGRWPMAIFAACSLAIIAIYLRYGRLNFEQPVVRTVGYTLIAAGFAALIALALTAPARSWLRRSLAIWPLTNLGRYSYGIYVFHVPIILLLKDAGLQASLFPRLWGSSLPGVLVFCGVGGLLSLACAAASYHLWEAPFLRLKRFLPYRAIPQPHSRNPAIGSRDVPVSQRASPCLERAVKSQGDDQRWAISR